MGPACGLGLGFGGNIGGPPPFSSSPSFVPKLCPLFPLGRVPGNGGGLGLLGGEDMGLPSLDSYKARGLSETAGDPSGLGGGVFGIIKGPTSGKLMILGKGTFGCCMWNLRRAFFTFISLRLIGNARIL